VVDVVCAPVRRTGACAAVCVTAGGVITVSVVGLDLIALASEIPSRRMPIANAN